MKMSRMLGACTVALVAIGMAFSASASATLPEIGRCVYVGKGHGEYLGPTCVSLKPGKGTYKWEEGAGEKKKFSGSGEATLLETTGGKKILCSALILEGEYTGAKTATMTVDMKGCVLPTTKQHCQSSPSPTKEAEIETSVEGEIGFIRTEKPIVGWDLKGWNVTVSCGEPPETSITVAKIEGSVIGAVKPTGKMLEEETLKFTETAGKQNPEQFEGQAKDVLTSEFTTGIEKSPPEQTGLRAAGVYENEEPLEIKVQTK